MTISGIIVLFGFTWGFYGVVLGKGEGRNKIFWGLHSMFSRSMVSEDMKFARYWELGKEK